MSKRIYHFTKTDLISAYTLLFSETGLSSMDQIYRISNASLKTAYRDKAKKNHPDRARHLGVSEAVLVERFKQITQAYNDLSRFIQGIDRAGGVRTGTRWKAGKTHKPGATEARFTHGKHGASEARPGPEQKNRYQQTGFSRIPEKEIPLGQYLLYHGVITLRTLIQAIQWQRMQRPQFGLIAREWKLLTREEITSIFRNKRLHEKIGECALRLGYLNSFQHRAILSKQKNIQRPIGQYFVEQKILSAADLERHLYSHRRHNARARINACRKKSEAN
jgi:hypothetical protein